MRFQLKSANERWFLVLCLVGSFAILSSTMSKNPVLKPFASSLGTPDDLLGFVASASTIPGMLVSLPAASLSDFLGRRRVLLLSTLVFASAPFLYLFVTVWWQLILVRFYHGFATAIFVPVTAASIAERFPTKRGERISLLSSATAVGRAAAPFLGGYILYVTNYGYSTLYFAVGIAGVTAFLLTLLLLVEREKPSPPPTSAGKTTKEMLHGWSTIARNRYVLAVSFIQASQYYVFGAVEFFFVGYLGEIAKLDAFSIGAIMGAQILALIFAGPVMGRVSDKIGRRIPIISGSLACCLTLVALPFFTQFAVLLFISAVYGLSFTAVIASTSPFMCELAPCDLAGTSLGFLSTMMDVGQTIGPIVSGFVLAATLQYSALFFSLSLLLVFSVLIFVIVRTPKKAQ